MVKGGFFDKLKKAVQKTSSHSNKSKKSQGCCELQIVEKTPESKKDKTKKGKGCCNLQIMENGKN